MKRIKLVIAGAAVMATMIVGAAAPAMAKDAHGGGHVGAAHPGIARAGDFDVAPVDVAPIPPVDVAPLPPLDID